MSQELTRRNFVKGSLLTSAGLALAMGEAGRAGAAEAPANPAGAPAPKDALPKGKIGKLEVSRILLGGNLLTHFTHSRDLRYVYALAAHYNTDAKILETLAVAEANGVNTLAIHTVPSALKVLKQHRKERGGKMQWIICPTADIQPGLAQYSQQVQQLIDDGTDAIYLWGVRADALAGQGKIDLIGKAVELAKAQGVPSGVGAHDLNVIKVCEQNKIPADFYIKTLHHHNYPSAKLGHDSMWCSNPQETVDLMKPVEKPWIAFKVMAAGAIPPKDAFQYVFQNGADFSLAGMFDFEIAEDVRIAKEVLAALPQRARPWRG
jgi:hypothetical protein